ncbi:TetR/AcrR family transcriptional regulator [Nonomuraea spiralis]|uniref:TetR/AcrR family transcriptional regulator n=1 Tax=Nonomuraea spiralis TaxID=46182 RepID=A0ABV5IZK8_9ACTN|nr:TetR family transcriptional regulator C-terminal domain-containing protein [Nonomuraea spiralis]GGT19382.1 putative transcriptional regulator, TetR family protein [Nonomuraea spiralis]
MSDRQQLILEAALRVIARDGVRGLRVEKLAAEAKVSTSLIYYHFENRAGLMRRTLEFVSEHAGRYTSQALEQGEDARKQIELLLSLELQDTPAVRQNSAAWGELRASATFDPDLREPLQAATREWVADLVALISEARAAGLVSAEVEPTDSAERLTALVEGLSERWLSGTMTLERAQRLLSGAIEVEFDRP